MEGLKKLQYQQSASFLSLGAAITSMVMTVQEFMHSSGSRGFQKRKRDELSDSEEHEGDDAISESMDMNEACDKLVNGEKKSQNSYQKVRTMLLLSCQRIRTPKEL